MPKKKRFRGKKDDKKEEILIEPESVKMASQSTEKPVDSAPAGSVTQTGGVNSVENKCIPVDREQGKQMSGIPKKRFSFTSKKKKPQEVEKKESQKTDRTKKFKKSGEIQRSHSLSLDDAPQRSKIPLPKYSTLQHKDKNLSTSCSNFETQSMTLNPDVDGWRMTGLLKNIEKSNSLSSLTSPSSSKPSEIVLDPVAITSKNSLTAELVAVVKTAVNSDIEEKQVADNPTAIMHDLNESIDVINDTIIEENEEQNDSNMIGTIATENDGCDTIITNNSPIRPVCVNKKAINHKETKIAEKIIEEYYELDEEKCVTIQLLEDLIIQQHMEIPTDITSNEWLVLDIINSKTPIETC